MNKRDLAEYRRLIVERDNAKREYERLQKRREELAARKVRDEDRRGRFLLRLDGDIAEAHERLAAAEIMLEELEGARR